MIVTFRQIKVGKHDNYYCVKCKKSHDSGSNIWHSHKEFAAILELPKCK